MNDVIRGFTFLGAVAIISVFVHYVADSYLRSSV